MNRSETRLRQAALVMRLIGWGLSVGLIALLFVYPPGFLWGAVSPDSAFPHIGPAHPPSPHDALHPYLFMLAALYVCLLYTSPSPRDRPRSRMPSSA